MRVLLALVFISPLLAGDLTEAQRLFRSTDYSASLNLLANDSNPDAATYALMGKDEYMLGNFKMAIEDLTKAADLNPSSSDYALWLGRSYGRKAQTGSPFTATGTAKKAAEFFEKAVELDPKNADALYDLFEFRLQAPSFVGGSREKAEETAKRLESLSLPDYYSAKARLAEHKKQFEAAEEQLRRAVTAAPQDVGRVLDLANFLARQHRFSDSEAAIEQAAKIAPDNPRLLLAKARLDIEQKRNLENARVLLEKYRKSSLTPDDPPKQEADKLLKQVTEASNVAQF